MKAPRLQFTPALSVHPSPPPELAHDNPLPGLLTDAHAATRRNPSYAVADELRLMKARFHNWAVRDAFPPLSA